MSDSDLFAQLLGKVLGGYVHDATTIVVIVAGIGRAIHALRNGGGVIGLWNSLLYGTNTPKSKVDQNEKPTA